MLVLLCRILAVLSFPQRSSTWGPLLGVSPLDECKERVQSEPNGSQMATVIWSWPLPAKAEQMADILMESNCFILSKIRKRNINGALIEQCINWHMFMFHFLIFVGWKCHSEIALNRHNKLFSFCYCEDLNTMWKSNDVKKSKHDLIWTWLSGGKGNIHTGYSCLFRKSLLRLFD